MKIRWSLSLFAGIVFTTTALCQTIVPPNPNKFERGGVNGGASVGATITERAKPATIIVTLTAVSPQRVWTNTDGKAIMARLLAFPSATETDEGPLEIIREGKIRLLLEKTKKPTEYPLEKLIQSDQLFVKSIAQATSKPRPAPAPSGQMEKAEESK